MVKNDHLIKAINLKVHFPVKEGFIKDIFKENKLYVKAVDGIDFYISHKETLGLVGESGCGKTTTGRALIGLNHLTEGKVYFSGEDISLLEENKIRLLRKKMQFIFQDPFSSLNPRMTVNEIIGRPMKIFNLYDNEDRKNRIKEILDMVGLSPQHMSRYPHEFSGGQRQRISIARALAVEPEFIIADEPTAALDVSIQCQILNLLIKLKEELGLTMMFISHDLGVINHISDRTAVMYLGKIVEIGPTKELFNNPAHPYTMALLYALPRKRQNLHKRKVRLKGSIPSPIYTPPGCPLHSRCQFAQKICSTQTPVLRTIDEGHMVSCNFDLR